MSVIGPGTDYLFVLQFRIAASLTFSGSKERSFCGPVLTLHGSSSDRHCLAWERQNTTPTRTNRLILYKVLLAGGSRPNLGLHVYCIKVRNVVGHSAQTVDRKRITIGLHGELFRHIFNSL
jgi:hypothetical protein